MCLFKLPKSLCKKLNSLIRRFWWGHQYNTSRCAWQSWDKLGVSKFHGGMGFRDLEVFNNALFAKQGWRLIQFLDSLVATILREKYFRGSNFLSARFGHNPSYAWRSIVNAREVLDKGLFWRVGNGKSIRIWGDKWLSIPSSYQIQSHVVGLDPEAKVSSLIDQATGGWNVPLIRASFDVVKADTICV